MDLRDTLNKNLQFNENNKQSKNKQKKQKQNIGAVVAVIVW